MKEYIDRVPYFYYYLKTFFQLLYANMASLVNKTDLQALSLVGPTVTRPVQDPYLNKPRNRLFIFRV